MYLKQLSVFVENQSGRLAEIADVIGSAGIDIRAVSIADSADFGVLRLIVNRPDEAKAILSEHGMTVSLTDVVAVGIDDRPGAFAEVLRVLCVADVAVEYMYAFISRDHGKAYVILRVQDNDRAASVLSTAGVELLDPQKIYAM